MLSKNQRLSGQITQSFFLTANKKPTALGFLYYHLDNQLPSAKVAFIAPKKTFPLAVQRHRAKRLAALIVQENYQQFPPGQFVFILTFKLLQS